MSIALSLLLIDDLSVLILVGVSLGGAIASEQKGSRAQKLLGTLRLFF